MNMGSFPFLFLLLAIFQISSLLIPSNSSEDDTRQYICSHNFSAVENKNYMKNLGNLFSELNKTPPHGGFKTKSFGQLQDRVHGLAFCQGDVPTARCGECLVIATYSLTHSCPNHLRGILWTDLCYVKYSDHLFYGEVDTENNFTMKNPTNITETATEFSNATITLLENLSLTATTHKHMFAVGNTSDSYGMVQCSNDLSKGNCSRCIKDAIEGLPQYGTRNDSFPLGGRAVTGSCTVRYENYNFTYHVGV